MKTNFLFIGLVVLAGITKGNAQNYSAPGSTAGLNNTCVGTSSGTSNTGNSNAFFGYGSGTNNTSNSNSGFGFGTLTVNTGGFNSAFGATSLQINQTGTLNSAFGARCMESNTTGSGNVAIGFRALGANVGGANNTALGYGTLLNPTNSSNNIAIGINTPRHFSGGGNNNIFIGVSTAENLQSGSGNTIIGLVKFDGSPSTTTTAGNDTSNTIILANGNTQQRLFIHSNGYTGIGLGNNAIPQNMLELNGGLAGTSGLRFRSYTSASTPVASNGRVLTLNANGDVVLTTDVGSGGTTIMANGTNTTVTGTGVVGSPYQINACNLYTCDGTLSGNRTINMNNNSMIFDTQANGRIYIGDTTTPVAAAFNTSNFPTTFGNYRLYVEGGILTERVKVALRSTANWADYVFANDYKLMPLREVESFINKNQHLPGIESASELQKSGLDIADMQAKQMGKIEELTLYIIEQNKTLEKQSKEIEELKAQMKLLLDKK